MTARLTFYYFQKELKSDIRLKVIDKSLSKLNRAFNSSTDFLFFLHPTLKNRALSAVYDNLKVLMTFFRKSIRCYKIKFNVHFYDNAIKLLRNSEKNLSTQYRIQTENIHLRLKRLEKYIEIPKTQKTEDLHI